MHSLKQQLLLLVLGPLVLLSICGSIITGMYMKDHALLATDTKAKSDLATGEAIIELMYPGPWEARDGILYKGGVKISNNFAPVDKIAALTGDTVTIFLGDIRVSTTVREKNGERALGTKVSEVVATNVLKHGQEYLGQANVVGELYQTAYKPIRDANGKIVGIFYVGISKKFSDQLINNPLIAIVVVSVGLTLIVGLGALFFTQRVIIGPLQQITMGTREAVEGHHFNKVNVSSTNEIGELAKAYNQMLEGMQSFALHISKSVVNSAAGIELSFEEKKIPQPELIRGQKGEELPKGLNEVTLKQILTFLESRDIPLSAEEIGEGASITRVTARRYLEYLEKNGRVTVETKYGTVGRPLKLYRNIPKDPIE